MPAHVGDRGITLAQLHPCGLVQIGDDRRGARALLGTIDGGVAIVVVGWDPFGLLVRPAAEVHNPAGLPNYGQPCPSPQDLTEEREADSEEVRRESSWARNFGSDLGDRLAIVLPLTVVAAGAGWVWAGVPAVAIGALAVILIAALILAWLVLN